MVVLALAFLFTIGWGILLKKKNNLNAHQKRKSIFRLDLDLLNSMLAQPIRYKGEIDLFEQWLSSATEPQVFVV